MVTTVLIPMFRKGGDDHVAIKTFAQVEKRFSKQARITIILVGLSGFYMLYYLRCMEPVFRYSLLVDSRHDACLVVIYDYAVYY